MRENLTLADIGYGKVEPDAVAMVVAVRLDFEVVLTLRHQLLYLSEVAALKVAVRGRPMF
jgi:hypothetical protein